MRDFAREWMWSEAVEMLARAERLHREFFRPTAQPSAWEPPADILETDHEVLVIVALPGVPNDAIEAAIDFGRPTLNGNTMPGNSTRLRTGTMISASGGSGG